ncbi:hypothetical protein D9M72_570280 [compost metagenome]
MQAQHDGGLAGDHVGGREVVVDEADFPGALARRHDADRMVVQRTEVNLQLAAQDHIKEVVAAERRQHHFTGFQLAGAEIRQKLFQAGRSHVLEQSEMLELLDVFLPTGRFHGTRTRDEVLFPYMCTTDSPCSPLRTLNPEY